MKSTPVFALLLAVFLALPGVPVPADENPVDDLSPEDVRVEAWWLVSMFRFDEARKMLGSLEEGGEAELALVEALEKYAMSLFDFLVVRGKTAVFKLKDGGTDKGIPKEITEDGEIILHNKRTVRLAQLNWFSVASLSRSAAKRKGPEADALCATAYLLCGDTKKVKAFLRRAKGDLGDAARKLAEEWPGMAREFEARSLAGAVLQGSAATFRPAAERLRDECTGTRAYERLKEQLRETVIELLREEGKVDGELRPMEKIDLKRGRIRLSYGFLDAVEGEDWQLLSFEEATKDLHKGLTRNMIHTANKLAEEADEEVMDVEKAPTMDGDDLVLPSGSAIRHHILFKGDVTVSCEFSYSRGALPYPYMIVHGGDSTLIYAFGPHNYHYQDRQGNLIKPAEKPKDRYNISGSTVDLAITIKKNKATLVFEEETCGTLDPGGPGEGYVQVGFIGAGTAAISRLMIEGETIPESAAALAETRIRSAAAKLVP